MADMFYNGYKLPDINAVWTDKTSYPYALISMASAGKIFLHLLSKPLVYNVSEKTFNVSGQYQRASIEASGWEVTYRTNNVTSGTTVSDYVYYAYWTNVDILCDDDTLYLAASIPVAFIARMNRLEAFMLGQRLRPSLMGGLAVTREMSWIDAENKKLTFEQIQRLTWPELIVRDWPDK